MANVQYDAHLKRGALLSALGAEVRALRHGRKLTIRALAETTGVSERFLVQLEQGEGNISVARLAGVAAALGVRSSALLERAEKAEPKPVASGVVALVGLRGAGKSTVGARLAKKLDVPFVELDVLVAREAGMSLATIFELHGEEYFRHVERQALSRFLGEASNAVLATSGSIVSDEGTYTLLRKRAKVVWLKAKAEEHWSRVVAQGDGRPMKGRANAMSELRALLKARAPLYARADVTIDTSEVSIEDAAAKIAEAASTPIKSKKRTS